MRWDGMRQTEHLGREGRQSNAVAVQCRGNAGGEREGDESEARESGHDANMVAAAPLGSPRKAPRSTAVNPASVGTVAGQGLAAL